MRIASRFRPLEPPRWQDDDCLARCLRAFERLLPLKEFSRLGERSTARLILDRSGGITGQNRRDGLAGCGVGDSPWRRAHHARSPRPRLPGAAPAVKPLSWVVAPHADEWLGFWLHRVSQTYGLRVRDLLAHAGALSKATTVPTWARLPSFGVQDLERVSCLLHEPATSIERMPRLVSPLGRTAQAGYCWHCLVSDREAQHKPYWRRDWMDPYTGWCGVHRTRLGPVDASELRQLATAPTIGALMATLVATPPAPDGLDGIAVALPPGASLALQAALREEAAQRAALDRPWHRPLRQRVDRIAGALIQELRHGRPVRACGSLARLASDLKLPIAWSPLPQIGGLC